jgi:predicted metalloprotease
MRWTPGWKSDDVEDRRGEGGGGLRLGGGGVKLGLGGMVLVGVLSLVLKRNLFADLSQLNGGSPQAATPSAGSNDPEQQKLKEFVSFVLDDIQNSWKAEFASRGATYPRAKLVLFSDEVRSACGAADAATGPFYCPGDQKAYIDLSFYRDLKARFGAPGDFAQAYVIAHELGHHLQNVLQIEPRVRRQQRANPEQQNALSVRMELQADCFAGIWAKSTKTRGVLEEGDAEEALNCAAAIGDDRLQKQARGRVAPETFTHGSSEQRMRWFKKGFDGGQIDDCDTFKSQSL